ncbi:hypothetical protein BRC64_03470 [Halobacteriales archaeon QH_10_67_22]|nr:MAG: hypothetical protein BRC64_03470 [Halobacteriales archaeon QH_10_67_22]
MNRRRLLSGIAGGCALAVTGCLGEEPGPGAGTDEPTETMSEDTPEPTEEPAESPTEEQPEPPTDTPETSVTDRSFEVTEAGCGRYVDEAEVAFEDESVDVTGTTNGSQACYTAELDAATYDPEGDELTVDVVSVRTADEDQACADCIAEIDYEAMITFARGLPDTVTVVHVHGDERRTVATVER